MKHTAIVGMGPIGQYLAYKLYEAGVRNIILIERKVPMAMGSF